MIDGTQRKNMKPGLVLVARYKGEQHSVEVVGEPGHALPRFRLADGREFKSPSAAGSAIMGGIACNGWRFFSVDAGLGVLEELAEAGRHLDATLAARDAAATVPATRAQVAAHAAAERHEAAMAEQRAAQAAGAPVWEHEDDEARQVAKAQRATGPKARPVCGTCGKHFISAAALAHHEANADRLCKAVAA